MIVVALELLVGDAHGFSHGWARALDMQFIDFGYQLMSAAQASFVAAHYPIVSIEKCTNQPFTEKGIWDTAAQLKSINPNTKVLFYISMTNDRLDCYQSFKEFLQRPEWWLRNASGGPINQSSIVPYLDFRIEAARKWWTGIPFNQSNTSFFALDGALLDHTANPCPAQLLEPNCSAWKQGQMAAALRLREAFHAPPPGQSRGEVLCNGITMYTNPGFPADNGMSWVNVSDGLMAEHVATFEGLSNGRVVVNTLVKLFNRV